MSVAIIMIIGLFLLLCLMMYWAFSRFIKCPSDKLLVVYGKVEDGNENGMKVLNGGAAFVWPVIQDYEFIDLTPYDYPFDSNLLTKDGIEINVAGAMRYSVSNNPTLMNVAASRLLGIKSGEIQRLGSSIISGQLSKIFANQDVVEITALRSQIIEKTALKINTELNKIGLHLINIKLDKINDKKGFIKQLEQAYKTEKATTFNNLTTENLLPQLADIDKQIEQNTKEREILLKQKLTLLMKHKI